MYAKSLLVALAAPALISGAAIPQNDPVDWNENTSDIVGGVAAAQGDFPFIVSVQIGGRHDCGGTLLNANTVVSAAHCFFGRTSSTFRVRAGSLVCDRLLRNKNENTILTFPCRTATLVEPSPLFPQSASTPTITMPAPTMILPS
jgi:hypothetical protein